MHAVGAHGIGLGVGGFGRHPRVVGEVLFNPGVRTTDENGEEMYQGCDIDERYQAYAGQESVRSLYDEMAALPDGPTVHLVGGADVAAELDAKRAIKQGTEVAAAL